VLIPVVASEKNKLGKDEIQKTNFEFIPQTQPGATTAHHFGNTHGYVTKRVTKLRLGGGPRIVQCLHKELLCDTGFLYFPAISSSRSSSLLF
jgi:hypothetical protein